MKPSKRTLLVGILLLLGLACNVPTLVPTPQPLPSSSPTWTLLPPLGTPAPTETAMPLTETATAATKSPTATVTETSIPEFSCPNAPVPRMKVEDNAQVTFTDGVSLRVRKDPVVAADNVLLQIPEGTRIKIIGGPVCAPIPDTENSYVFWEIRVRGTSERGWVAEGDSVNYYIEPTP